MFKSEVYKTWTLVLQIGITMLVPIFLFVLIAYLVKKHFNFDFMLIGIILGLVVGVRNVYMLLKNHVKSLDKNTESELMKRHMKSIEK